MRFDNVTAALASNAKRRPAHPAVIAGDIAITHGELEIRVQHAAGLLREQDFGAREIVGLSMRETIDHIVVIFAMMRLGIVIVPLDIRWTAAEKLNALHAFGSGRLLTDTAGLALPGISVTLVDGEWMDAAARSSPVEDWTTTEDSPLLLSLSSGTTGLPKGPMIDHGLFMRRLFYETVTAGTSQADVNMLATPIYFGGGRNITLQNILIGATVVLYPPPYEVEELVREINRRGVTTVFLVPTLLRRLLSLSQPAGLMLPNLRMLMCSGAMLNAPELTAIRERITPNLMNAYATTDGGIAAVLMPDECENKSTSVGRPAYLTEMQIVDDEHRPVRTGDIGRIRYRTLAVADSYYNNPEETAAAFHDHWFYPGDLGHFDVEGFLYVVGRSKDMIIRGGINIYPAEIESVISTHPDVVDVAVVGWNLGDMGEEIAALVVGRRDMREEELLRHASASLARYKVPSRVFFLRGLPRNDAGKVNKKKLTGLLPDTLSGELANLEENQTMEHLNDRRAS